MTLVILPVNGVQHEVLKGQTLAGIANKYGADPEEVAAYNGLDTSSALAVGSEIIIPGGEVAAKKVAKKATATKTTGKAASSRALPALSGFFGNPLPGGRLSQGIHGYNGVDIAAPSGTPIYAAAGGSVIVAKNNGGYNGGYGNYIVIDHGNGTQTLYAHMTSTAISGGASAEKGTLIGYVGNTGKSTGNHLHFEVRGARNPFAK
jgi:murein DD-endopeptidase MepM/ murein hydrolase activator NlpD